MVIPNNVLDDFYTQLTISDKEMTKIANADHSGHELWRAKIEERDEGYHAKLVGKGVKIIQKRIITKKQRLLAASLDN